MVFLALYVVAIAGAAALGLAAAWHDYRGMIIPNAISVCILALFAVFYATVHFGGVAGFAPLAAHLFCGGAVFAITFVMFMTGMIGGGDAKLVSAYAFWFSPQGLAAFLCYTVLLGGLLAVAALLLKKRRVFRAPRPGSWIARVQGGESVIPYGIPIALGAIFAFFKLDYVTLETFELFLIPKG